MQALDPRAAEVLDFWFGEGGSPDRGQTRDLWFTKRASTDALIRERFGALIEEALRGERDSWAVSPRDALALILVLDQFTRNAFRDTPRAFAGDTQALATATNLVDLGRDRALSLHERWFAYLPFEHAESLAMQDRSVELFTALAHDGLAEPLEWAIRHRDVVARFGRFPHRNQVLARPSTATEREFLEQPGSRF
jgi:uncharacterized protein (DUF924 family)